MLHDRRRFYRWKLQAPCLCIDEHGSFTADVSNLSFGGARVENPARIPAEGSELRIIIVHDEGSISLTGHVFWVSPPGEPPAFGVEFYGSFRERSRNLLPLFRRLESLDEEGTEQPFQEDGKPL